jgi:hypothetical protein
LFNKLRALKLIVSGLRFRDWRFTSPVKASMTRLLVDTARYTVTRQNDGSIEIAPKDNPKGMRIFHRQAARHEGELIAAYHRNGFVGVDRLCARLLADAGEGARRGGSVRARRHLDGH